MPSGRISETVTWRSTLGAEALIHACTAPPPTTTVFAASGALTYDSAVPGGFCSHWYWGVAVHSPPGPEPVSPVKSVGGSARAFHVN